MYEVRRQHDGAAVIKLIGLFQLPAYQGVILFPRHDDSFGFAKQEEL